jgi:hypothetical protein
MGLALTRLEGMDVCSVGTNVSGRHMMDGLKVNRIGVSPGEENPTGKRLVEAGLHGTPLNVSGHHMMDGLEHVMDGLKVNRIGVSPRGANPTGK